MCKSTGAAAQILIGHMTNLHARSKAGFHAAGGILPFLQLDAVFTGSRVCWLDRNVHSQPSKFPQNMCASFQRQWCNIFDNQENHKSLESQQLLSSKTSTCSVAGGDAKSPAAWVKISGFGLDFVTSERTRWPMTSRTSWKNSPKNSGWIWEADRLISKISGTRPGLQWRCESSNQTALCAGWSSDQSDADEKMWLLPLGSHTCHGLKLDDKGNMGLSQKKITWFTIPVRLKKPCYPPLPHKLNMRAVTWLSHQILFISFHWIWQLKDEIRKLFPNAEHSLTWSLTSICI